MNILKAMIKSSGKNALPEIEISSEALENNMEKYRNALESLKTTLQVKYCFLYI